MEKVKKNASFLLAVILAVVMCAGPVYAEEQVHTNGTWNYDVSSDTWTYTDKQQLKNTWGYIVNPWNDNKPAWFMFDGNGKMLTGWQLIYRGGSAKYYYFHEADDGHRGECQLGGITPDGYTVNEDGAWTVDGAVQEFFPPRTESSGSSGSSRTVSDGGNLGRINDPLSLGNTSREEYLNDTATDKDSGYKIIPGVENVTSEGINGAASDATVIWTNSTISGHGSGLPSGYEMPQIVFVPGGGTTGAGNVTIFITSPGTMIPSENITAHGHGLERYQLPDN